MQSILCYDKSKAGAIPQQTAIDLALCETISLLHRDEEASSLMVRMLMSPCLNTDDIAARQAVLRDFIANADAAAVLIDRCREIVERTAQGKTKSRSYLSDPHHIDQSGWILAVQNVTELLLEVLRTYAMLLEDLQSLDLKSDRLIAFKEDLSSIVTSKEYGDLCEMLMPLTMIRTMDTSYIILITLSDDFRHMIIRLKEVKQKMHIQKDVPTPENVFRLSKSEKYYANNLVAATLRSLYRFLLDTTQALTEPFADLREELLFYECGQRYCRLLNDKHIGYSFPTLSESEQTHYTGLRDIYLSLCRTVPPIANDYREATLSIITGSNNSGKTVFLRSIGIAQLFAQAGLPLPVKEATVSVKRHVLTLYAANEKDMGRFEEECNALRAIVHTIQQGDILLLNEPFQSTAYSDAAAILGNVLSAFMLAKIPVIIVTHLTDLHERLQNIADYDEITAYHAAKPFHFHFSTTKTNRRQQRRFV